MKVTALILAAGMGSRMMTDQNKQFLELMGYPILYHSLKVFQDMSEIDGLVLVVKENEVDYITQNILSLGDFNKIEQIVIGGKERSDSVYNGLKVIHEGMVLIHDGARPLIEPDDIKKIIVETARHAAAAIGVPTKDTIKVVDDDNNIVNTPNRDYLWAIQTPQGFNIDLIKKAYDSLYENPRIFWDDTMLVETVLNVKVKMVKGSDENIKMTTPIDLIVGTMILKKRWGLKDGT